MIEERILEILKENPTLSNREIGKLVGKTRGTIQYYMNKLNIHRDRKAQQKLNNTCRQKSIHITQKAEQIILGSILGDGYMSPNRHPEDTHLTLNSELRISHGIKQKGYIEYKKCLLEKEGIRCTLNYTDTSEQKKHYIKGIEVISKGIYYLKTQRNVSFNYYRDMFYRPNKKLCRYLYRLDALGLAIWFMDDGFKNGRGWVLSTDCFTIKETQLLRDILKHNFDLDTTIRNSSLGNPQIYIRTSCREKFLKLVSPYICDCMHYKLEL